MNNKFKELFKNISFVFLWLGLWQIISSAIKHYSYNDKQLKLIGFFIVFLLGVAFTLLSCDCD
jgi:hypothetical protein